MKTRLTSFLVSIAVAPLLQAQSPASTPLGLNQLHTTSKQASGSTPAHTSKVALLRQTSRLATTRKLQQQLILQQQRVSSQLARLPPAIRHDLTSGSELVDVVNGRLMIRANHNENAAITSNTHLVRNSPQFSSVDGTGINIGVWEVGVGSTNGHPEWNNRYTFLDGAGTSSFHAAHVIGTIAATGTDSQAMGMAPSSNIRAYNSTGDTIEMAAEGAVSIDDFTKNGAILVSNHSYGFSAGWHTTTNGNWWWLGNATATGPTTSSLDPGFGQYSQDATNWDQVCWDAPYYLPVRSAGNERNDAPPAAGAGFRWRRPNANGGMTVTVTGYNPSLHPGADAAPSGGYDTIPYHAVAKNVLTVGATEDGVFQIGNFGMSRWLPSAQISEFSSWGPADDGRIKPDIVANGVSLYSTGNRFPTGQPVSNTYESTSGTSMASPTVCGSAALLHEYFGRRFPGDTMRAATLKALLLHTTDDLGTAGPDYIYGWGLLNTERAAQTIKDHANAPINRHINEGTISQGNAQTFTFFWNERDEPIRATLCWTDPAGTPTTALNSRASRLVNDLDLDIRGPGDQRFDQYRLDPSNPADLPTTGDNDVDNVRQVFIADPLPGLYTLTIQNDGSLQNSEQDFSLVITGNGRFHPLILPVAVDTNTPYEQHFEDANPPYSRQAWTYRSNNAGRTRHTGSSLRMDDASPGDGDGANNSATLHLDLEGQENVVLEFAWRDYLDAPHTLPVTTNNDLSPGDGVMLSLDGSAWHRLINLPVDQENGWKTEILSLDDVLTNLGLTPEDYTSHVQLRFFQYGTRRFPNNGIDYDSIRVYITSPGEFSFASSTLTDLESTSAIPVTVFRNNGTGGAASVDYTTSSGSASPGSDFTTTSGTLDFADGQNTATVNIPITNNATTESTESFLFTLSNPTGGADLGVHSQLTVTLIDDDTPPETIAGPGDIYPVAIHGTDALPQSVIVQNRGGGVLNYSVAETSSWITVTDPGSGRVSEDTAALVSLAYDTSHLPPGRYHSTVRIVDGDGFNPDSDISVHLLVGHPGDSVSTSFAPGVITVPVNKTGRADHYPAELALPGVRGRTSNLTLAVAELFHPSTGQLEIALQSPAGIPVALLSDVANFTRTSYENIVFSGGGSPLTATGHIESSLPYAATNLGDPLDDLPSPASDIFLSSIGDFTGSSPAGTWELFIADDLPAIGHGSLGEITLTVETAIIEDVFAERFNNPKNPFDLAFTSLVFTPDPTSPFGYTSEQLPLDELPSKAVGTSVSPSPDNYIKFNLSDPPLLFYGRKVSTLYIGENGTIGMGALPFSNTVADHTAIAALKTDLDLAGGTILVDERTDRVVVTYSKLKVSKSGSTVTFQIELFHDDRIRITYGDIHEITADVGLSRGTPENWSTSYQDLSKAPDHGIDVVADHLDEGLDFGIAWTSQPDVLYHILISHNLLDWKIFDTVPGAPGTATLWAITGRKKAGTYYRIQRTTSTAAP